MSALDDAELAAIKNAAEQMAARLRALREFVGEFELRGEGIDFELWTKDDEAALGAWELLVWQPFTTPYLSSDLTREEVDGGG